MNFVRFVFVVVKQLAFLLSFSSLTAP